MTRFMDKSFSTFAPAGESYRENWDRIFKKPEPPKEPELCQRHHLPMEPGGQCPYTSEIHDEVQECDCCDKCRQDCLDDI